MSRSLNEVSLIGNVGVDPEVRTTGTALKVATFTLATSQQWNNSQGVKEEKTQWHRLVAWNTPRGGLADVAEKYVKKGDKLYIKGEIEYREWTDREGVKRYTTEIKVRELIMLGSKNAGDAGPGAPARNTRAPNKAERTRDADNFDDFPGALDDDMDDSLPF